MTKKQRERAVAIAKDVIKLTRRKSIMVKSPTTYCRLDGCVGPELEGKQLKDVMAKVITTKRKCTICALNA